jgi:hypothetical protein
MNSKRLVWLNVFQFVAIVIAVIAFAFWAPWASSLTAEEAAKKYPGQINPSWHAVTVNHGTIREWRLGTPGQNPVGFSFCSVALFSGIACLIASAWYYEKHKISGADYIPG